MDLGGPGPGALAPLPSPVPFLADTHPGHDVELHAPDDRSQPQEDRQGHLRNADRHGQPEPGGRRPVARQGRMQQRQGDQGEPCPNQAEPGPARSPPKPGRPAEIISIHDVVPPAPAHDGHDEPGEHHHGRAKPPPPGQRPSGAVDQQEPEMGSLSSEEKG